MFNFWLKNLPVLLTVLIIVKVYMEEYFSHYEWLLLCKSLSYDCQGMSGEIEKKNLPSSIATLEWDEHCHLSEDLSCAEESWNSQ